LRRSNSDIRTIGPEKYFIEETLQGFTYDKTRELHILSQLLDIDKSFLIHDRYFWLLEDLGFQELDAYYFEYRTPAKALFSAGGIEIPRCQKLFVKTINKEGDKLELLFKRVTTSNNKYGNHYFYYLTIKGYVHFDNSIMKKENDSLTYFDENGQKLISVKLAFNSVIHTYQKFPNCDPIFSVIKSDRDIYVEMITYHKENEINNVFFNCFGKQLDYSHLCELIPEIEKISKGELLGWITKLSDSNKKIIEMYIS